MAVVKVEKEETQTDENSCLTKFYMLVEKQAHRQLYCEIKIDWCLRLLSGYSPDADQTSQS